MANRNRPFGEGMIFHSDRGIQYACKQTVNLLKSLKLEQSMSGKGIYSTPHLSDHRVSFLSLVRYHCKPLFVPGTGSVKADLQVACHSLDRFRGRHYLCLQWKRIRLHTHTRKRAFFYQGFDAVAGCCNR